MQLQVQKAPPATVEARAAPVTAEPAEAAAAVPPAPAKSRRSRLRWTIAIVALLAGAAVATLMLRPRTETLALAQRDFVQTVVASGHVEAPHRVSIAAQIVASVVEIPVVEGQTVAAGQVLVRLDDRELRALAEQAARAVEQAELRLRSVDEVQHPVAEQSLRQAQVNLDNARAARERTADLFRQGFVGQAALDDAQKAFDLAEAQLRSAVRQRDALAGRGSDRAGAAAALAQARAAAEAARVRLQYTSIVAPAAGVLIAREVEPGDVVQPGKALMTLSPLGATELVVQIDERNLGRVAIGQKALASADAFPDRRFTAEVSYINPGVDAQRGSVEVKLRVPAPPAELRQDMTVSVDIEVARRDRALLVPVEALHDAETAPWVLRVEKGVARRRAVKLGLRGSGTAEVLDGLAPGDRVVPVSAQSVRDGDRLREATAP
jgi:HlyD family secretion protein